MPLKKTTNAFFLPLAASFVAAMALAFLGNAQAQTISLPAALSGNYTNSGTLATGSGLTIDLGLAVNYIIVGGGGGGGGGANGSGFGGGGGGGGGNVATGVFAAGPQVYSLTIGGGGAGGGGAGAATAQSGTVGGNSSIFGVTTLGGGGGGAGSNTGSQTTLAGDGGGSGRTTSGTFTATTGGGNNFDGAGGGAGANGNGSNGTDLPGAGGIGGAGGGGVTSSITSGTYGGGGGGGGSWDGSGSSQSDGGGGLGGSGGGGAGAQLPGTVAASGTNGLGGGGGGGGYTNGTASTAGGSGGSGTVIVAYSTPASTIATGGTVTTSGGNTIHSFASGSTSGSTSSITFSFDTSLLNAEVSGVISGSGALTYAGAGTLALTAANTYSGGTIVNSGSLIARGGLSNNSSNTLTANAGGMFIFGTSDVFANHSGTVQPTIVVNQGGTVRNSSGAFNALGAVTLNGGTLDSAGVSSASGVGFALKGTVTANGSATSTISGTGIGLGSAAVASTTFNVADGAAATDLLVSGVLRDGPASSWPNSQASSLVKTGAGTMVLAAANTYTGSTTISGGTLRVGAGSTAGTLGSGAVINNAALIFDRSNSLAVDNSISGNGSLAIQGAGTVTLSGANSYSGGTSVSAGRLVGTSSSLQGAITNDAVVEFSQAASGTYASNMAGSGSIAKSGSGTLTISGNNTFSGGVALNAGTVALGSVNALGSSGTISFGGGTLQYSLNNTTDYSNRFSSAAGQQFAIDTNGQNITLASGLSSTGGSLTKVGAGNLTLTGTNSYSGGTTLSAGKLVGTTASLQGSIANDSIVVFDQATTGTFTGSLSGIGAVEKSGAGTVVLGAANSHSGGTTVNAGTLAVTANGALGSVGTSSGVIFGTGLGATPATGTARDANWSLVAVPSTWSPPTSLPYAAYVPKIVSAAMAGGNTSGVQNGYTANGTTVYWIAPRSTVSGLLPGSYNWIVAQPFNVIRDGEYSFTFGGAGDNEISFYIGGSIDTSNPVTPVITGGQQIGTTWNSFTTIGTLSGTASLTAGTHTAYMVLRDTGGDTGALITQSSFTPPAGTIVNAGSTLDLRNVAYTTSDLITLNGATLATSNGTSSWGGTVSLASASTVDVTGDALSILGAVSGTGALTKNGNGTLTLNGSNSYTGGTTINTGSVIIGNANGLGTSGNVSFTGGGLQYGGGITADISSRIKNSTSAIQVDTNGNNVTFSGVVDSTNSGGLTKNGSGTLTLNGSNTYTGGTTISAGTLAVGSGGAISDSAVLLIVGHNSGDNGTLTINGGNVTSGTGSIGLNAGSAGVVNLSSGNWTNTELRIGDSGNGTLNLSGGRLSNSGNYTAIGHGNGSTGVANVSSGEWTNGDELTVGAYGYGTLNITGGNVINQRGFLATEAGSTGVVNVSGGNWMNTNRMRLGRYGNGTLNLTGGNVTIGAGGTGNLTVAVFANSTGTLNIGNGSTVGTLQAARVTAGNGTATVNFNHSGNHLFSPILEGNLTVNKLGSGTTILSGNNTYTGGTTISSGTITIGDANALGTSGNISFSGGGLQYGSGITTDLSSRIKNSTSAILLDTNGNHVTFSSALDSTNSGGLTKNGNGTLTLSSANSYTGGTTLNSGTLVIGNTAAVGAGTITQASGASLLKIDTTGTITNALDIYHVAATQSATLSGPITVNNATWDIATGETLTVNGTVSGPGGVTKNGGGTLVLSGNNTYDEATVINAGILEAANANALGSNATVTINDGTLLVTADDAINGKNIQFSTSTLGLKISGDYSGAVGSLTLSANSSIDLGEGSVEILFQGLALNSWFLNIYNWTGTTRWDGGTGNDQDKVYVGPDLTDQALTQIYFYSGNYGTDSFVGTGYDLGLVDSWGYQIIPVPEPETWATGILLLLGGAWWMWRNRKAV